MKNKWIYFLLLPYSTASVALFCPGNFNQINLGDTTAQVIAQCGKPDEEKTTKVEPTQPQEWNYYMVADPSNSSPQGSLKMSVAFDANKKVVNITVNGTSLVSTTLCGGNIGGGYAGGNNIQLGDTSDTVKTNCGKPMFINQNTTPADTSQPTTPATELTEYKYHSTPPTTLIFENGKLKERK
ncbi:hypothetical protein AYO45_05960 [Gammaproteobacteria bacterium SCGC AG-212-F23]|nr:hypothetical protein AYO45_05960 [Gammaproteobacteria bacterium SCGC AG-212-F23]